MRHLLRLAGSLLLSAAVVAVLAAAPSAARCPDDQVPPLLDGVPDVDQTTDYSCGPCALAAVLAYYGVELTEAQAIEQARTDPEVGAEMEDLVAVAARHGVEATIVEGLTLSGLERELAARRPVIVLNQSWRTDPDLDWKDAWDDGHYLVVIGIDARAVYVEDPSLQGARGVIPRGEFVARWHGWTLDERQAEGQAILFRGEPRGRPYPIRRVRRVQ